MKTSRMKILPCFIKTGTTPGLLSRPTFLVVLLLILLIQCKPEQKTSPEKLSIWFKEPASTWEATLPLGNGHLGMMPDGQIAHETILLNDITLWSGGVQDPDNPEAAGYLPEIQRLLAAGKNDEAQDLMYRTFTCKGEGSGSGNGSGVPFGSYEVLGNLHLWFDLDSTEKFTGYHRELLLDHAMASTSFTSGNTRYLREYFVSFTEDAAVIHLTADRKGKINFRISMDRPEKYHTTTEGNILKMTGQLNNGTDGKGMKYLAMAQVITKGGTIVPDGKSLAIKDAREATVFISAGTSYNNPAFESSAKKTLTQSSSRKFRELKKAHIREYCKYFDRVVLDLPGNPGRELLSTPERLQAFATDPNDNGLIDLYFQFGRYLLISSAHAGILPPNLQGLWAKTIQTPWNGDYHLNINVQMNHWPAEITNLPEMHKPLINLTKSLVTPGTKTAKAFYNAGGWVAHVITNIWGFTTPSKNPAWGATNTGGAWLCAHLWDHYDFNRDTTYLRQIYPVLKGAARFFRDVLMEEPSHGWLVTAPSSSPENSFLMPRSDKSVSICMGPTMDNQLVRELFGNTVRAARLLGTDEEFGQQLQKMSGQLPPNRIGSDGRLMEWLEEYTEKEPQHRHVSHLYGLHPGNQIVPEKTPELSEAARKSLERRGDGGTGWSRAWKINFWARLYDGNHAYTMLGKLLEPVFDTSYNYTNKGGTYPNLFCAHPPFQIDGNFGGCAGIAEMLLQSHAGFVNFIPALPDQFSEGSFSGLKVRGNAVASASWKNKKLNSASLTAGSDADFKIKLSGGEQIPAVTVNGSTIHPRMEVPFIEVSLKKGDKVELRY